MLYIYYIMTISSMYVSVSSMVKNQHGILKLLMDHIMEYHRVTVSGLKTKMVILRYDGAYHILSIVIQHHAGLMSIGS